MIVAEVFRALAALTWPGAVVGVAELGFVVALVVVVVAAVVVAEADRRDEPGLADASFVVVEIATGVVAVWDEVDLRPDPQPVNVSVASANTPTTAIGRRTRPGGASTVRGCPIELGERQS